MNHLPVLSRREFTMCTEDKFGYAKVANKYYLTFSNKNIIQCFFHYEMSPIKLNMNEKKFRKNMEKFNANLDNFFSLVEFSNKKDILDAIEFLDSLLIMKKLSGA